MSDTKSTDTKSEKQLADPALGKDQADARQRFSDQAVDPRTTQDQVNRGRAELRERCAQEVTGAHQILVDAGKTMSLVNEAVELYAVKPNAPGTLKPGSPEHKQAIAAAEVAYLNAIDLADSRLYERDEQQNLKIDPKTDRPLETPFLKQVRQEKENVALEINALKRIKAEGRPLNKNEMELLGTTNPDTAVALLGRQKDYNVLNDITRRSGYATATYGLALQRASVGLTGQDKESHCARGEFFIGRAAYLDNQMTADVRFQTINDTVRADAGLAKQDLLAQDANSEGKVVDGKLRLGNSKIPSGEALVDGKGFVNPLDMLQKTEANLSKTPDVAMSQSIRDEYLAAITAADSINRLHLAEKIHAEASLNSNESDNAKRIKAMQNEISKTNALNEKVSEQLNPLIGQVLKTAQAQGPAAAKGCREFLAAIQPVREVKSEDLYAKTKVNYEQNNQAAREAAKAAGKAFTEWPTFDEAKKSFDSIPLSKDIESKLKEFNNNCAIIEATERELAKLQKPANQDNVKLFNSSEIARLAFLYAIEHDKDQGSVKNQEDAIRMRKELAEINPAQYARPTDATTGNDATAEPVSTLTEASVSAIGRAQRLYDIVKQQPKEPVVPLDKLAIPISATESISVADAFKQLIEDAGRIAPAEPEKVLKEMWAGLGQLGWTQPLEDNYANQRPEILTLEAKRDGEFGKLDAPKQEQMGQILFQIGLVDPEIAGGKEERQKLEAAMADMGAKDTKVKAFLDARQELSKFYEKSPLVERRREYEVAKPNLINLQHAKAITEGLYGAALLYTGDKAGAFPYLVNAARDKHADAQSPQIKEAIDQYGRAAILEEAAKKPLAVKIADQGVPVTDASQAPADASAGVVQSKQLFQSALNALADAGTKADQVKPDGKPLSPELEKTFLDAIQITKKLNIEKLEATRAELRAQLLGNWSDANQLEFKNANEAALAAQDKVRAKIQKESSLIGADVPPEKRADALHERLVALGKKDGEGDVQAYLDALRKATARGAKEDEALAKAKIEKQFTTAQTAVAKVPEELRAQALDDKLLELAQTDLDVRAYVIASTKATAYAKREEFALASHQIDTLVHGKGIADTLYAGALIATGNPADLEKAKLSMKEAMKDLTLPDFFPVALSVAGKLGLLEAEPGTGPGDALVQSPDATAEPGSYARLRYDALVAQDNCKNTADAVTKTGQPLSPEVAKVFTDAIEANSKLTVEKLEAEKTRLAKLLLPDWNDDKEKDYQAARQNALLAAKSVSAQLSEIGKSVVADKIPVEQQLSEVNKRLLELAKTDPAVEAFLKIRDKANSEGWDQAAQTAKQKVLPQLEEARKGIDVTTEAGQKLAYANLVAMSAKNSDVLAYLEASNKTIGYAGRERYQAELEQLTVLKNGQAICQTLYATALQKTGNAAELDKAKATMKLAMADENFILIFPPAREQADSLGLIKGSGEDISRYRREIPGFNELVVANAIMADESLTAQEALEKAKPLFDLSVAKSSGDLALYNQALAEGKRKGMDMTEFVIDPEVLKKDGLKAIDVQLLDLTLKGIGTKLTKVQIDIGITTNAKKLAELKALEQQYSDHAQEVFTMRQQPSKARSAEATTLNTIAMQMYKQAETEKETAKQRQLIVAANGYNAEAAKLFRSIEKADPKVWNKSNGEFAGAAKLCEEHKAVTKTSAAVVGEVLGVKKLVDMGVHGPVPAAQSIWVTMDLAGDALTSVSYIPGGVGDVLGYVPKVFAEGVSNTARNREGAAAALYEAMTKDQQLALDQVQGIQTNYKNEFSYVFNDLISAQAGLALGRFAVQVAGNKLGPWGKGALFAVTAGGTAYGGNLALDAGSAQLLGTTPRGSNELLTRTAASVLVSGGLSARANHLAQKEALLLSGSSAKASVWESMAIWNKPSLAVVPGTALKLELEGGAVSKLTGIEVSPLLATEAARLTVKGRTALEAGLLKQMTPEAFGKLSFSQQLTKAGEVMKAATKAERGQVSGNWFGRYMYGSGNAVEATANLGSISGSRAGGFWNRSLSGGAAMGVYGLGEVNPSIENRAVAGQNYTWSETLRHAGLSTLWGTGASAASPLVSKTFDFVGTGLLKSFVGRPIKYVLNSESALVPEWAGVTAKKAVEQNLTGWWRIGGEGAVAAYAGRAGIGLTGGGTAGFLLHNPWMINRELAKQEKEAGLPLSGKTYTSGESWGYAGRWGGIGATFTALAPLIPAGAHEFGEWVVKPAFNKAVPGINKLAVPAYNHGVWAINSTFNTTNMWNKPVTDLANRALAGYGIAGFIGTSSGLIEHGVTTKDAWAKALDRGHNLGWKVGAAAAASPWLIKGGQWTVDKAIAPVSKVAADRLSKTFVARTVSDASSKYAASALAPLTLIEGRAVGDGYAGFVEIPRIVALAKEGMARREAFLKLSVDEQQAILKKEKEAEAARKK